MLSWVSYDETMAHLPQAAGLRRSRRSNQKIAAVRVNDAEALLEAVLAGLGRSLLPCVIADRDSRLRRLGASGGPSVLSRELWLLTHSDLRRVGRIEAVVQWIGQIAPR
jgi:DNA-binding transcriptional LysR family regulator